MSGLPLILAHLLFIYALVVEPILGVRMYRTLKHSPPRDDEALVRFYRRGITSEWLWVLWIGVILVSSGVSLEAIGLVWTDEVSRSLLMFGGAFALGSAVAIAVLVLRARAAGGPGIRASLEQMLEPVSAFLPSTRKERWLFAGLSITAGICEEILFRGFLIFYLSEVFPGLPVVGAVIASSLIFGLAHLYQGGKGVLTTSLLGAVFAFLYVSTGSLFVPIILHALLDLRILVLYRPR